MTHDFKNLSETFIILWLCFWLILSHWASYFAILSLVSPSILMGDNNGYHEIS